MIDNENSSIGKELKRLRMAVQLTQEEIAYRCNVDRRYIYDLENDIHRPGFDVMVKLAWAFGMEPEDLIKELNQKVDFKKIITDFKNE